MEVACAAKRNFDREYKKTFATKSATTSREQMQQHAVRGRQSYSITSSARASRDGGTSMPSTFAVVTLMTRSNLVGCSIGRSAALAPRRILSTKLAARRNRSGKFAP